MFTAGCRTDNDFWCSLSDQLPFMIKYFAFSAPTGVRVQHFFNFERCTLHHHFLICSSGTILIHYIGMVHDDWLEPYWYSIMYITLILFIYIFNNLERNMSAKYVLPYQYGSKIYSMYKYNLIVEQLKVLILKGMTFGMQLFPDHSQQIFELIPMPVLNGWNK